LFKRDGRGSWIAAWLDHAGKRRERSTRTTDRATAQRILAKWVADAALRREGIIDPRADGYAAHGRRPLAEHVEVYLDHCRAAGLADEHVKGKARHLRRLIDFMGGAPKLADLDADTLERYLWAMRERGAAARSVNFARQQVVAFANWCTKSARLETNPLKHVPKLDESTDRRRVRRALTDDELARLLAVAKERGREAWYMLAAYAGLRRGDLRRLEWADVDLEAGTITIRGGKAKRVDVIPMHPHVCESLKALKTQNPAVPGAKVFPEVPTTVTVRKDFLRAGIELVDNEGRAVDLHALRTTLGTRLARAGVPPQVAMRLMRHADYRTTLKHYTVLGLADSAAALAKLPSIQLEVQAQAATGTGDAYPSKSHRFDSQLIPQHKGREIVQKHASYCADGDAMSESADTPKTLKNPSKSDVLRRAALKNEKAGDGIRTHDVQLGKLAFYH